MFLFFHAVNHVFAAMETIHHHNLAYELCMHAVILQKWSSVGLKLPAVLCRNMNEALPQPIHLRRRWRRRPNLLLDSHTPLGLLDESGPAVLTVRHGEVAPVQSLGPWARHGAARWEG